MSVETLGQQSERIHDQQMRPDVRTVPIEFVRTKDHLGLVIEENARDPGNAGRPVIEVPGTGLRIDSLETVGGSSKQVELEVVAGSMEFIVTFRLALLLTAVGHRDVDDPPLRLPKKPQGEPTHDALVIGVRGEKQRPRCCVCQSQIWMIRPHQLTKWKTATIRPYY